MCMLFWTRECDGWAAGSGCCEANPGLGNMMDEDWLLVLALASLLG